MQRSSTDCRKQALLAALKTSRFVIATACESAGVGRRTFYYWMDTDADFKRAVEDTQEEATDYVESKLMQCIDAGKERSIIFYLKTKGRKRGYQERGESDNEMLERDEMSLFGNSALKAVASRFSLDELMNIPDPDDLLGV
jgi:tRNA(Leu) C34 or U34 (ribose-2'-O)-methylase TrmL